MGTSMTRLQWDKNARQIRARERGTQRIEDFGKADKWHQRRHRRWDVDLARRLHAEYLLHPTARFKMSFTEFKRKAMGRRSSKRFR